MYCLSNSQPPTLIAIVGHASILNAGISRAPTTFACCTRFAKKNVFNKYKFLPSISRLCRRHLREDVRHSGWPFLVLCSPQQGLVSSTAPTKRSFKALHVPSRSVPVFYSGHEHEFRLRLGIVSGYFQDLRHAAYISDCDSSPPCKRLYVIIEIVGPEIDIFVSSRGLDFPSPYFWCSRGECDPV